MQNDAEHLGAEMRVWVNPGAERATLTRDSDFETSTDGGWERLGEIARRAGEPSPGRLARMRQRVDALLTEMLADECDQEHERGQTDSEIADAPTATAHTTDEVIPDRAINDRSMTDLTSSPSAGSDSPSERTPSEPVRADGPSADGSLSDALPSDALPSDALPSGGSPSGGSPSGGSPSGGSPADNSADPEPIAGDGAPDQGFWRRDETDAAPADGYQSKHRLAGPPKDVAPRDSRRAKPRHAAPPVSLITVLGRRLASGKLAGYCATHAA